MRNPLFYLIASTLNHKKGNMHLKIEEQVYDVILKEGGINSTPYYLVKLPIYPKLQLRGREYTIKEGHATFFSEKSPDEGYLSAYHVTLHLGPILIRVYFNENDVFAMEPKAWLYNEKESKTIEPLPTFFNNNNDSNLISLCAINSISQLIGKLRELEKKKRSKLENEYNELIKSLENNALDTSKKRKLYVSEITLCIGKLEELKQCSLNPESLNSLIKIHKSQLEFVKELVKSTQQLNLPIQEPISSRETFSTKNEELPTQSDAIVPPPKVVLWQDLADKVNLLNKRSTLDLDSAKELNNALIELEKIFFTSNFITAKDQFDCLGSFLTSRNRLGAFCLECLEHGDDENAEHYYSYLTEIPPHFIEKCIQTDNVKTIEKLIQNGKISLNTVLADGTTMYEKAYKDERIETSLFFYKQGVPLGAVFIKILFESLSKGELDLSLIAKSIKLNASLLPKIPVPLWPSIWDATLKNLYSFRQSLSLTNAPHSQSNSRRRSAKNKLKLIKENERSDNQIQLIDFFIELIKFGNSLSKCSPNELQTILDEGIEKQQGLMNLMQLLGLDPKNLGTVTIPENILNIVSTMGMKIIKPFTHLLVLFNQKINKLPAEKQREFLQLLMLVDQERKTAPLLGLEINETVNTNNSFNKLLNFCINDLQITLPQIMKIFTPLFGDLMGSFFGLFESFSPLVNGGSIFQRQELSSLFSLENLRTFFQPESANSLSSSAHTNNRPSDNSISAQRPRGTNFSFWQAPPLGICDTTAEEAEENFQNCCIM